jgi:hypothetical protein
LSLDLTLIEPNLTTKRLHSKIYQCECMFTTSPSPIWRLISKVKWNAFGELTPMLVLCWISQNTLQLSVHITNIPWLDSLEETFKYMVKFMTTFNHKGWK